MSEPISMPAPLTINPCHPPRKAGARAATLYLIPSFLDEGPSQPIPPTFWTR